MDDEACYKVVSAGRGAVAVAIGWEEVVGCVEVERVRRALLISIGAVVAG